MEREQMRLIKNIFCVLAISNMLVLTTGCKKTDGPKSGGSGGFIKEFNFDNQPSYGAYIEQVLPGEMVIVGGDGNNPLVLRIDLNGNVLSHRRIILPDNVYKVFLTTPDVRSLHDGSYTCSFNGLGKFVRFDTSGHYYWGINDSAYASYNYFSDVLPSGNHFAVSMSNGSYSGATTLNYVQIFDNSGHKLWYDSIPDAPNYANGKTLSFIIFDTLQNGGYKAFGQKFDVQAWNWGMNGNMFIGTTKGYNQYNKTVDSGVSQRFNYSAVNFTINPNDSAVIIYGYKLDYLAYTQNILFLKFDKNLILKNQTAYNYNGNPTNITKAIACRDGGYLLCGYFTQYGSGGNGIAYNNGPYLIRLDANGNKLWEKVINTPGTSIFNACTELNDGSFVLTGSTVSFGKGLSPQSILVVKLDAHGNM